MQHRGGGGWRYCIPRADPWLLEEVGGEEKSEERKFCNGNNMVQLRVGEGSQSERT